MKQWKQIAFLVVLVVAAAGIWIWNSHQAPVPAGASTITAGYSPMTAEIPPVQWWKIERVRKTEYKSSGRNPFSAVPPPPPVQAPPKEGDAGYVKPAPLPPPPGRNATPAGRAAFAAARGAPSAPDHPPPPHDLRLV